MRRLVETQFPRWAGLPVEPVANGGWDNRTFHLGTDMVVRLPSAAEYAQAVEKEHRWLPALAPQLPLPIPVPLAKGEPSAEYPHPWSIYRWLDGRRRPRTASPTRSGSRSTWPISWPPCRASTPLTVPGREFTTGSGAAHCAPTTGTPGARSRNWTATSMSRRRARSGRTHSTRAGTVSTSGSTETSPRGTSCSTKDSWRPSSTSGRAASATRPVIWPIAWTLLTADGRQAFRDRLSVDAGTWARGRGWALWKALATCSSTFDSPGDAAEFASAKRVLDEIFSEPA